MRGNVVPAIFARGAFAEMPREGLRYLSLIEERKEIREEEIQLLDH